jgi:hypothetical protein
MAATIDQDEVEFGLQDNGGFLELAASDNFGEQP